MNIKVSENSELLATIPTWSPGVATNSNFTSGVAPAACEFSNNLNLYWLGNAALPQVISRSYAGAGSVLSWSAATPVVSTITGNSLQAMSSPDCCVLNNIMYMFYLSSDKSGNIMCSVSSDGQNFTEGLLTPNYTSTSPSAPACCVFNNKIYVFWQGNGDSCIYYSTSTDGRAFSKGVPINSSSTTPAGPSCCVDGNTLYVFTAGSTAAKGMTYPYIYYASLKNGVFSQFVPINTVDSINATTPACCVSPAGVICVFWRSASVGANSNTLYWSLNPYGASTWPSGSPINNNAVTLTSPAACNFGTNVDLFWINATLSPNNPVNAIDISSLAI